VAQAAGSERSSQTAGCHGTARVITAPQAIALFHLARALVSRTSAQFFAIYDRSNRCMRRRLCASWNRSQPGRRPDYACSVFVPTLRAEGKPPR